MSQPNGQIKMSRIALLPDGGLVEAVVDSMVSAFARWCSTGAWSAWTAFGGNALDVSMAAADVSSADTAYVSVTFNGQGRGVYTLSSGGGFAGTAL